ncbi:unnamed protein product, partial [Peniophora sp. CBMAI 1063]
MAQCSAVMLQDVSLPVTVIIRALPPQGMSCSARRARPSRCSATPPFLSSDPSRQTLPPQCCHCAHAELGRAGVRPPRPSAPATPLGGPTRPSAATVRKPSSAEQVFGHPALPLQRALST